MSGFPEKGADLRGTSGEVWETSGSAVRELPENSGDFPEARGSLTSFSATRRICLQSKVCTQSASLTLDKGLFFGEGVFSEKALFLGIWRLWKSLECGKQADNLDCLEIRERLEILGIPVLQKIWSSTENREIQLVRQSYLPHCGPRFWPIPQRICMVLYLYRANGHGHSGVAHILDHSSKKARTATHACRSREGGFSEAFRVFRGFQRFSEIFRGFQRFFRDPLRGRFRSQRLSVLLPLIVLPLELSPNNVQMGTAILGDRLPEVTQKPFLGSSSLSLQRRH